MPNLRRVAGILAARPDILEALAAVARLGLPEAWIGAGLVRNAVWDAEPGADAPQPASDIDVVHFDPRDATRDHDHALKAVLAAAHSGPRWSVKNQARMRARASDAPYAGIADAIGRWPETCTAVAARLAGGRVEVLAPWGVADLLGRVVGPTPAFARRLEVFDERVRAKAWAERWAGITVIRAAP